MPYEIEGQLGDIGILDKTLQATTSKALWYNRKLALIATSLWCNTTSTKEV